MSESLDVSEAVDPSLIEPTSSAPRELKAARLRFGKFFGSVTKVQIALAAILLLALGLRLYGLTNESLWNDELSTISRSSGPPWTSRMWRLIKGDVHPPLYVGLMWLYSSLFGDGEFAIRFPSVVAGVAGVFFVYRLGSTLYAPAAGLAAALLSAVSPLLIQYSQEARAYAALFLVSGWMLLAWLDILRDEPNTAVRRRRILNAGLASATAAYLHYSGLLFAMTVGALALVFAAVGARARLLSVLKAAGLALLLYAPWFPWLLDDLATGGLSFLNAPTAKQLADFPSIGAPAYVYMGCAILGAAGTLPSDSGRTLGGARGRLPVNPTLFLSLSFILLVLGTFIKSRISAPIYNVRNLIVVWPAVFVVLGAGALRGYESRRELLVKSAYLSLIALLVILELAYVSEYYKKQTKEHFRQATSLGIEWIADKPATSIVSFGTANGYSYYLKRLGSKHKLAAHRNTSKAAVKSVRREFDKGARHVLVLTGHTPPRTLLSRLSRDFNLVQTKTLRGATVSLLTNGPSKRGSKPQSKRKTRKHR